MQHRLLVPKGQAYRHTETAPGCGIRFRLRLQNFRQRRLGQTQIGAQLALPFVLDLHRLDMPLPGQVQLPMQSGQLAMGANLDHGLDDGANAGHNYGRDQGRG